MVDKMIFDGLLARCRVMLAHMVLTVRVLLSMMRWKRVSSSRFSLAGR
jgi:hypothetical protein